MKSRSCFLVENPLDLFYLTGLKLSSGRLLVAPRKTALFVDGRYLEATRAFPGLLMEEEGERQFLKSQRVEEIIFDSAKTSCERLRQLKKRYRLPMKARPHLLRKARVIKKPEEVVKMQESARLAYAGYRHIAAQLKTGVSEKELALAFKLFCLKEGAEEVAFEPIVAFGKNSALPHHRAGPSCLKKGDLVLLDLGVQLDGYASDMTRTCFFGKEEEELGRLYQIVRAAHRAALALCLPGTKIGALDVAARSEMAKEGVEELFLHSLGHGIGLEVHEFPLIKQSGPDSSQVLEEGMVITIEPGLYLPGKGGARYEDTILITSQGFCNFYPDIER